MTLYNNHSYGGNILCTKLEGIDMLDDEYDEDREPRYYTQKEAEFTKHQAMISYYKTLMPKELDLLVSNMDAKKIETFSLEALSAAIIVLGYERKLFSGEWAAEFYKNLQKPKKSSATRDKVAELENRIRELEVINRDLTQQLNTKHPGGRNRVYNDEFKEMVRSYAAEGHTHKQIAAHFKIGTTTVNRIINH